MADLSKLQQAEQILTQNSISLAAQNTTYTYITPSPEFYGHHWLWDSAIHSMALSYVFEDLAWKEFSMLFIGQWENGHIGHIRFNPKVTGYFPGPEVWNTKQNMQDSVLVSGITQPPIIASALRHLVTVTKNKERTNNFVQALLPKIMKFHDFLKSTRDPDNTGLITTIHPWESGMDNSPRWDIPLSRIYMEDIPKEVIELVENKRVDDKKQDSKERPLEQDYYKYIYLVYLYAQWNWDINKILLASPFKIKDISTNCIWAKANADLASLCTEFNLPGLASKYTTLSEQTTTSIEKLFDDSTGTTTDFDLEKYQQLNSNAISSLLPLYYGTKNTKILQAIYSKVTDPKQFGSPYPLPSVSLSDSHFEPERYWRGPSWPITNMLIIEGLNSIKDSNMEAFKQKLIDSTIGMIEQFGFWEYFHPITGKDEISGLGFKDFSWTAAIYIILQKKYR